MNAKLGWDTAVAASEPLFAEVVQLKAEIERLKAERDRLAAEIERLRAIIQFSADRVLAKLDDLHKQATTERSHYYVASCVREARAEIERLEAALRGAQEALGEGEWIAASDILFDALAGKKG